MSAQPVRPSDAAVELVSDPHLRLTLALVLSLLLWAPFGMATMHGDMDVVQAGIRYLVAFVGCRFAIGTLAHLVTTYRHELLTQQEAVLPVLDPDDLDRRRSTPLD